MYECNKFKHFKVEPIVLFTAAEKWSLPGKRLTADLVSLRGNLVKEGLDVRFVLCGKTHGCLVSCGQADKKLEYSQVFLAGLFKAARSIVLNTVFDSTPQADL